VANPGAWRLTGVANPIDAASAAATARCIQLGRSPGPPHRVAMQIYRTLSLHARIAVAAAGLAVGALPAVAAPSTPAGDPAHVDETQPNEAALRTIVDHWGDAELGGDVAYLEQLLAPEYRSVDAKGASHPRAMILEHAKHSAGSAEARKARDAYMLAHPSEKAVVIHGALGIVSYFNPQRGVDSSIRGSDVFVYEAKRWHAVISMHNGAN
jgi:hypothetical protein